MLNRPEALNALNSAMIRELRDCVSRLAQEDGAAQLVLSGAGTRAFCAGADIKAIYHQGKAWLNGAQEQDPVKNVFAPEYELDVALYNLDKPKTVIMDGVVMGGGYGLAAPCDIRIATENTAFAMPEAGIGFFADVGAAHHLQQRPGYLGTYCALSGETLRHSSDLLALGIATHYVPSRFCSELIESLSALENPDYQSVACCVARFHQAPDKTGPCVAQKDLIDSCFAEQTVDSILQCLAGCDSDFGQKTKALIETRAPLSLAVTLAHFRSAHNEDFTTVMQRELRLAARFMREPGFYEGVRAMLIDKDKTPHWPLKLEDITQDQIAAFMAG
jgi:enoyl-CoA hydratase